MLASRLLIFFLVSILFSAFSAARASCATVLILQFHNKSAFSDLNWVGESISETLGSELNDDGQIVFGRQSRSEALRRLSLRSDAEFTKASLIRLGQSLDADYLCYGTYDASLPPGNSELKNSSVQISAHLLDLRKMHDGPDLAEAGKLVDLSRLEEHLAWANVRYLNPAANVSLDHFLTPQKLTRVDAEESYIRGLLSPNKEQQQKWFLQAASLDPKFSCPFFELGRLALENKDYRPATSWLLRITPASSHYPEARFKLGLSAYGEANFNGAVDYFREVAKAYPLNEVFNDLGAAEEQSNSPAAVDDFRRASEGDPEDPDYSFNLGCALLRRNSFDEAARRLAAALQHDPDNAEARTLLQQAQEKRPAAAGSKPVANPHLKYEFDTTAFRQLKAMVQPKGSA